MTHIFFVFWNRRHGHSKSRNVSFCCKTVASFIWRHLPTSAEAKGGSRVEGRRREGGGQVRKESGEGKPSKEARGERAGSKAGRTGKRKSCGGKRERDVGGERWARQGGTRKSNHAHKQKNLHSRKRRVHRPCGSIVHYTHIDLRNGLIGHRYFQLRIAGEIIRIINLAFLWHHSRHEKNSTATKATLWFPYRMPMAAAFFRARERFVFWKST